MLSKAKDEKVVNPPQKPTLRNKLQNSLLEKLRIKTPVTIPIIKHPIIFITNVLIGNFKLSLKGISPIRYLSELPKAPPNATNKILYMKTPLTVLLYFNINDKISHMKNKLFIKIISCLMCLMLVSCSSLSQNKPMSKDGFALDTVINIKIYDSSDENIITGAFDLINKMETELGAHKEYQDIYKLNHTGSLLLSNDALNCIKSSLKYSEITDGAFDISIGAVSLLWDFTSHNNPLPDDKKIKLALDKINYKNIKIDGNTVTLQNKGMSIDLGAVAKGYIADKVKEYLISKGIHSAIINLGGNVLTIGNKSGKEFSIGIQDPNRERNEVIDKVKIDNKSVVTSGIYERYIEVNGKKYHHILNPKTGYPINNNILQTTIISDKSIDGDILSTSIFLMGETRGIEFINKIDNVECCIYTKDGRKIKSSGFDKYLIK